MPGARAGCLVLGAGARAGCLVLGAARSCAGAGGAGAECTVLRACSDLYRTSYSRPRVAPGTSTSHRAPFSVTSASVDAHIARAPGRAREESLAESHDQD